MENLSNYKNAYERNGGKFEIIGMESHIPVSKHPMAARRQKAPKIQRLITDVRIRRKRTLSKEKIILKVF
jgi:serine kinase of HPr protein (carbohydrate metabolism regulator)